MSNSNRRNTMLLRQGAPTIDGSEEILYFLDDPVTKLNVRLPTMGARVFQALASGRGTSTGEVQRFVHANYGMELAEADAAEWVALFTAIDLTSDERDLGSQLAVMQRLLTRAKKAAVLRKLPDIVAKIPFYSGYDATIEDFEALPIIGKAELRHHVPRMYVPDEGARYIWASSSGTTGERVQAPHITEMFQEGALPLLAVAHPRLDSLSHWALFMPAECGGGMACNMNPDSKMEERLRGRQLLVPALGNPSAVRAEVLERCARELREWDPEIISGAPSFLYAFARYAESVGLKLPSLKAIFYHVEPASLIHTKRIESVFGLAGRSLYIASELGWPAVEWSTGQVFASPTHILEVVRDGRLAGPGEIGNVVVTRTTQGSAVLLRYDTRDLARVNPDGTSMGRILGRPNTALVRRSDGNEIPSDVLDRTVTGAAENAISFYRLYRHGTASAPRFILECCPSGEGDTDSALRKIADSLRELLDAVVDVRKTNGIPPHRGGRMPLFVDEGE